MLKRYKIIPTKNVKRAYTLIFILVLMKIIMN